MSSAPTPRKTEPTAPGAPGEGHDAAPAPTAAGGFKARVQALLQKILAKLPGKKKKETEGGHGAPAAADAHGEAPKPPEEPKAPAAPKKLSKLAPVKQAAGELFAALFARDAKLRFMAMLFFTSASGLVVVCAYATHRLLVQHRLAKAEAAAAAEELREEEERVAHEAAEAQNRSLWLSLGRFSVQAGKETSARRGIADVEFGARCLDRETREFLEARSTQVRSQITDALIGFQPDELMTGFGKRRLKKIVVDRLNGWIYGEYPKGKVEEVYLTNLTLK